MCGRIVEDETGGVVLIEQRRAVFGRELLLLVGTENFRVLVGADQIVISRQKIRAVGQQLDRRMLPQCTIGWVGIGIEFARQFLEIETGRQLSRIRIHAVILFGGNRYAVFALSESAALSTVAPQCNLAE